MTSGGDNLARLLKFEDGTLWVARVKMRDDEEDPADGWSKAEVDTMAFLRTTTKAPVPEVFSYELTQRNPTGSAFMLMEFLPWNTVAEQCKEANGTKSVEFPAGSRKRCYRSLAAAHVRF